MTFSAQLPISFCIDEGEWMDPNRWEVLEIRRNLSFRNGLFLREMVVQDDQGRRTRIASRRLVARSAAGRW